MEPTLLRASGLALSQPCGWFLLLCAVPPAWPFFFNSFQHLSAGCPEDLLTLLLVGHGFWQLLPWTAEQCGFALSCLDLLRVRSLLMHLVCWCHFYLLIRSGTRSITVLSPGFWITTEVNNFFKLHWNSWDGIVSNNDYHMYLELLFPLIFFLLLAPWPRPFFLQVISISGPLCPLCRYDRTLFLSWLQHPPLQVLTHSCIGLNPNCGYGSNFCSRGLFSHQENP